MSHFLVVFFLCLLGVFIPLANYLLIWRCHHDGEGLQMLTFARNSWPLSSEGSLACHTYCDTGHPFIIVIFEDQCHSHLLLSVQKWSCPYPCFYHLGLLRLGFKHRTFRLRGERSSPLCHLESSLESFRSSKNLILSEKRKALKGQLSLKYSRKNAVIWKSQQYFDDIA